MTSSMPPESLSGDPDEVLLESARREGRILVTDDKDFGGAGVSS